MSRAASAWSSARSAPMPTTTPMTILGATGSAASRASASMPFPDFATSSNYLPRRMNRTGSATGWTSSSTASNPAAGQVANDHGESNAHEHEGRAGPVLRQPAGHHGPRHAPPSASRRPGTGDNGRDHRQPPGPRSPARRAAGAQTAPDRYWPRRL